MKKLNIDNYILQNYKNKTNTQMALECGCSKSTISHHRKRLGISATELNNQLREKTKYICSQYGKKTKTALAKELNCSVSFIKKILQENHLIGTINTVYYSDESYFDNIDSPQKAYFLGILASDGCIYRREGHQGMVSISLQEKDIEILENFKQELNTTKPILIVSDKRRENTRMASLQITSDKMCNRLLELGIGVRKTFDLSIKDIASNIPKSLISSFILGYFDGDGSIGVSANETISRSFVCISGPLKGIYDFQDILKEFGIDSTNQQDKRKYKEPFGSLIFTNTTQKYIYLKFIYSSKVKCLNRKKKQANELIKRIEDNSTNRFENIEAQRIYKSVVLKWEELLES